MLGHKTTEPTSSEDFVLAYALSGSARFGEVLSRGITGAEFQGSDRRLIMQSAERLFAEGHEPSADLIAADLTDRRLIFDAGGTERITGLASAGERYTFSRLGYHVRVMSETARLTRVHDHLRDFLDTYGKDIPRKEQLDRLDKLTMYLLEQQAGADTRYTMHNDELAALVEEACQNAARGILTTREHTGILPYDHKFKGLPKGQLTILAARPSHGKSALAGDIAVRVALRHGEAQDGQVLFFSAEMPKVQIAQRLVANLARIDVGAIEDGRLTASESRAFDAALSLLRTGVPITIDDHPAPTTAYIMGKAVSENARQRLRLIVFDHLEHTGEKADRKDLQLENALLGMFVVAKHLDVPFLLLQQLNREMEARKDTKPMLSDLRWTGFAEQIANTVLMCYHEHTHYDQRGGAGFRSEPDPRDYDLFVRKNRGGKLGGVRLRFIGEHMRFDDAEDESMRQAYPESYNGNAASHRAVNPRALNGYEPAKDDDLPF